MNDIEFCSVGCISTGREVFASTTQTLRWKWFYLHFFSPQSRGSLLPNYMSSCQPDSVHTYKHRLHAIPSFLNKMQWQYKSVETYFFTLPTYQTRTNFWSRLLYKNLLFPSLCFYLYYFFISFCLSINRGRKVLSPQISYRDLFPTWISQFWRFSLRHSRYR
jgi:hypothetical protein